MSRYKFEVGDLVSCFFGKGRVVAKNSFSNITESFYAVQLETWTPNDFSSCGIYISDEKCLTRQVCPTCGKEV